MEIDLLTARLILRAVQHGMPIEEALKFVEFALDGDEEAVDALMDLIRQSFRQGDCRPPTLEEVHHG